MAKCNIDVEIPDGKYCFTGNTGFVPCVFYWQSEDGEEGCGYLKKTTEQKPNTLNCKKWQGCPNPK